MRRHGFPYFKQPMWNSLTWGIAQLSSWPPKEWSPHTQVHTIHSPRISSYPHPSRIAAPVVSSARDLQKFWLQPWSCSQNSRCKGNVVNTVERWNYILVPRVAIISWWLGNLEQWDIKWTKVEAVGSITWTYSANFLICSSIQPVVLRCLPHFKHPHTANLGLKLLESWIPRTCVALAFDVRHWESEASRIRAEDLLGMVVNQLSKGVMQLIVIIGRYWWFNIISGAFFLLHLSPSQFHAAGDVSLKQVLAQG